jgi:hypothetical protein
MITLGMSSNLVFVTFMPELVFITGQITGKNNDARLNNKVSGIFNACFSLGFFLAPILNGYFDTIMTF